LRGYGYLRRFQVDAYVELEEGNSCCDAVDSAAATSIDKAI